MCTFLLSMINFYRQRQRPAMDHKRLCHSHSLQSEPPFLHCLTLSHSPALCLWRSRGADTQTCLNYTYKHIYKCMCVCICSRRWLFGFTRPHAPRHAVESVDARRSSDQVVCLSTFVIAFESYFHPQK